MVDPLLRLLDANLNRAREGLRVEEDYARFVRDDRAVGGQLKSIRHRLTIATRALAAEAIAHRDVAGDVGTGYAIDVAAPRLALADVVTAAGKRVGEALRAVEEYLKLLDPPAAAEVEACRYAHYAAEQALALTFAHTPQHLAAKLAAMRLYVIVTEAHCAGRPWEEVARAALAGGADVVQLREKEMESGELLRRARRLVALCREHDAISIVNDRPDVARLADADGVHVGQGDLGAADARRILGPGKLVGVSTHEPAHALQAAADGADYLGVGPVFPSATKPREITPGLAYARQVATEVRLPAVAIAGITPANVGQVAATGMRAIAVTSAVCAAPDVEAATRKLRAEMGDGVGDDHPADGTVGD